MFMLHGPLTKASKLQEEFKLERGDGHFHSSVIFSISPFLVPDMDIIQCRMCHLKFPGEKCSRGRGICTGTEDEACMVGRIFKG
jgi:hypothetical protein